MSHYEERLENDLANIREVLVELADDVTVALQNAIRSLLAGDDETAHLTALGDHSINRRSRKLDWLCHAFISRHLPSAHHLRLMSSTIRVNVALERIGDYAVTICRESLQLTEPPKPKIAEQLQTVAQQVESLLDNTIKAFVEDNADGARALMAIPQQLETAMDGVYDKLIDSKKRSPREIVALFVVFSLLKRVADQAKNVCDQTLFAVSGEAKPTTTYRIAFVDETNSYQSQIAAAIASKRYPESGHYSSAGLRPAKEPDSNLQAFLESHGIDTDSTTTQDVEALQQDLRSYDVLISLDKNPRKYFPSIPFHTAALRWQVRDTANYEDDAAWQQEYEETYRSLAEKIDELMLMLVGDDAE